MVRALDNSRDVGSSPILDYQIIPFQRGIIIKLFDRKKKSTKYVKPGPLTGATKPERDMKNLVKGALIGVAIIVTGGAAVMVYNKVKKGTWNPFAKQDKPAPAAAPAPAPKPENQPEQPAAAPEKPKEDKQQ